MKNARQNSKLIFVDKDVENPAIEVIHSDNQNQETDERVIAHGQFLNDTK